MNIRRGLWFAVALAVRDLLGLDLAPEDLVDVARRAENEFVGAPTGVLDQSASLLCTPGHALFLGTRDRSAYLWREQRRRRRANGQARPLRAAILSRPVLSRLRL